MNYREKGIKFCDEINQLLNNNNLNAAFVTGGGFAYDSIKYSDNKINGDFDFMIVYDNKKTISKILKLLEKSNFNFEEKYLNLDQKLLTQNKIDIIRLSGKYLNVKSTINLVSKKMIEKISNFESDLVIKKVAHNRNTSLFFAYGSDNSRIITNFISPSFITEDGEDHYIHLDFSHIEKNGNIYLGILADAILKGFNQNYDTINFKSLREQFIQNIHKFFLNNNIDSSCFINLFSNNNYFPESLKEKLLKEFNSLGKIEGKIEKTKNLEPIIFTTNFDINYKSEPFNFIKNKDYKISFDKYIVEMQNNEYDRQYLLDALGKFLGYLLSSKLGNKEYKGNIIDKILVYGVNDLYLPEIEKYSTISIIKSIISDIKNSTEKFNSELIRNYLIICMKFLEKITDRSLEYIMKDEDIDSDIFNVELDKEMKIQIINKLDSFNEIGTYHNYTSKVMPKYTVNEARFIESIFNDRNAKVLDIMCGYGRLANQLVNDGFNNVTGIDSEKYSFLGIPKDFIFINDDYLYYNFKGNYDYAYSLYNCYSNMEELLKNISKAHSILNDNGIFIIDIFNKEWRDSIAPDFYKELYNDDNYKLVIKRTYDTTNGDEVTLYELSYKGIIIKNWTFTQRFFNLNDVTNIISQTDWNCSLNNSNNLETRKNEQKNIMILRKK